MKINFLRGENTNLKARERHYEATGKTGAALEVEKQRVHELEGSVEELQMTNAVKGEGQVPVLVLDYMRDCLFSFIIACGHYCAVVHATVILEMTA